jgi:hypothetical protein
MKCSRSTGTETVAIIIRRDVTAVTTDHRHTAVEVVVVMIYVTVARITTEVMTTMAQEETAGTTGEVTETEIGEMVIGAAMIVISPSVNLM